MKLDAIKNNFNRGRMDIGDIEWLIQTLDMRNKEVAEAIERELSYIDDIEQMEGMLEQANEENKRLNQKIRELRQKTSFKVWEENLRLAQELAELKGEVPV